MCFRGQTYAPPLGGMTAKAAVGYGIRATQFSRVPAAGPQGQDHADGARSGAGWKSDLS